MNVSLTFRRATPADDALLFHLFAEHRSVEFSAMGFPPQMLNGLLTSQYQLRVNSYAASFPDAEQWILETTASGPVGHMLLATDGSGIILVDIVVATAHRNQGIGTAALEHVLSAGLPVTLQTRVDSPAKTLYLRAGFQVLKDDGLDLTMRHTAPVEESIDA